MQTFTELKSQIIKLSQDPSNNMSRIQVNYLFLKIQRESNLQIGDNVLFYNLGDQTGVVTKISTLSNGKKKYTILSDQTNKEADNDKDGISNITYKWPDGDLAKLFSLVTPGLPPSPPSPSSPLSPSGSPLSPSGSTPIPSPPPGSFFGSLPPKKKPSPAPLPLSPPSPMTTSSIGGYNKYTRSKSNLSETSYYS